MTGRPITHPWALLLTLACSCGGDDLSYADEHRGEIREACQEIVQCRAQRGGAEYFGDDPIGECVAQTSKDLDSDSASAARFDTNFTSCSHLVVCDYSDCLEMGTAGMQSSYADTVIDKITYDCQATIFCMMQRGQPVGDNAVQNCINVEKDILNRFVDSQKILYDASYEECRTLQGCEFVDCFEF